MNIPKGFIVLNAAPSGLPFRAAVKNIAFYGRLPDGAMTEVAGKIGGKLCTRVTETPEEIDALIIAAQEEM